MREACAVSSEQAIRRAIAQWGDANRVIVTPEAERELIEAIQDVMRSACYDEPREVLADAEVWLLASLDPVRNDEELAYAAVRCNSCERLESSHWMMPGPDGYQVCYDCLCRALGVHRLAEAA